MSTAGKKINSETGSLVAAAPIQVQKKKKKGVAALTSATSRLRGSGRKMADANCLC